jgi:hypothetical protein
MIYMFEFSTDRLPVGVACTKNVQITVVLCFYGYLTSVRILAGRFMSL